MLKVCKITGCGKTVEAKMLCSSHYYKARRHGDPLVNFFTKGDGIRFIKEAVKSRDSKCILWPFHVSTNGYGRVAWGGKVWAAHRVVLAMIHGDMPEMDASHLPVVCHNRKCINPAHLRWLSRSGNQMDRVCDDTSNRGEAHPMSKLTTENVLSIRSDRRSHENIAKAYGVSSGYISSIKSKKAWAWL